MTKTLIIYVLVHLFFCQVLSHYKLTTEDMETPDGADQSKKKKKRYNLGKEKKKHLCRNTLLPSGSL
jgi:hypothetical protein